MPSLQDTQPYSPQPDAERMHVLRPLLDYLAGGEPKADGEWQGWQITRIGGGRNNLLYRARGPAGDLAIKFTLCDSRDRAGREYNALLALQQAGLSIAPQPVLLDRTRYSLPVVVQTWLAGKVNAAPPTTDEEWQRLVEHLATVHSVTPERTSARLPEGVLNANSAGEGCEIVRQHMARLPREAQPARLRTLVQGLEKLEFLAWPAPRQVLCRVDPNPLNMIRRPGPWASVDWENAGWGDPAFEIADLITHAAYLDVPSWRWEWVTRTYNALTGNPGAAVRIEAYRQILLAWWAVRMVRYLYEMPRGIDRRLAEQPEGWQADMQSKYERYLERAEGYDPQRARRNTKGNQGRM